MKQITKIVKLALYFIIITFLINNNYADDKSTTTDPKLDKIDYQAKKFKAVLEIIYKNYDDSVNIEKLSNKCFNAMLNSLDPFSHYFSPDEYKSLSEEQKGSSESIGLTLFSINDTLTVLNSTKNSPADSCKILPGDQLLSINGKSVIGVNVNDANELLRGVPGSKAIISIKKFMDGSILEYELIRKEIEIPSIITDFIFPKSEIAFIKMLRFSKISHQELTASLDTLISKGAKSLILDLRDNPGGFLDVVINICKDFVKKGQTIASIKSNSKIYDKDYVAEVDGKYCNLPLVVLINENSASASEIFAGMVQDLDRGLVVGKISMGKGLVQKYWNYTDTSAFRITVAKYLTPSGRLIQKDYSSDTKKSAIDPSITMNMDSSTKAGLDELIKLTGGKTQLPIFKTLKGRNVLGGGGIFPDIISKLDTNTVLLQVLKSKGIFLEYTMDIYKSFHKEIYEKFPDSFMFSFNYIVNDALLANFVSFFKSKNIWNEQMFGTDKEAIRNFLKSNIGYFLWGDRSYYAVGTNLDNQLIDAIKQLTAAGEMLK